MSPKAQVPATADLLDEHGDRAAVCQLPLCSFGGRAAFAGAISTIRCYEDNVLLARRVSEPGGGRVLVVMPRARCGWQCSATASPGSRLQTAGPGS